MISFRTRRPAPPLDALIELIWCYEAPALPDGIERILPRGTASLHVSLSSEALCWYDGAGTRQSVGAASLCGAHATPFAIETRQQRAIVGAELTAVGAAPLFGAPAGELAHRHLALEDLWGREAALLCERLFEAPSPEAKLLAFERSLRARLATPLAEDAAVAFAVRALDDPASRSTIADVTGHLGLTPKRFIQRFTDRVGLTPKRYQRVRRFQRALSLLDAPRTRRGAKTPWPAIALACGYYDQAHFNHDFRAFTGLTPTDYLAIRRETNHVPIEPIEP